MSTREQDALSDAEKIWAELDAEESGAKAPAATESETSPVEAAEQTPESAAPVEETGESVESVSPDQLLQDKIAGLEATLSQVTQRLRNAEGHIGGLNSQLKQQQQLAAQVTAKGGEAPSAQELRAAQSSPEAMATLKRDYPEFATAMESALNERVKELEQRLTAVQQPQQQFVTPEQLQRMRDEFSVETRHPGWQQRVQTPEFTGWLQRQPREVQMLATSPNPQDAVRLLDLHTDAVKSVSTQRTQRLSSAAAIPSGRNTAPVRSKSIEDMTPEEYWRYLDELDKSKG